MGFWKKIEEWFHEEDSFFDENKKTKLTKKRDYSQEILDLIIRDIQEGEVDDAFKKLDKYIFDSKIRSEIRKKLKDLKKELQERIDILGQPLNYAPSMSTINGIGTKIYGDTQYFVIFFIPIIPIARYSFDYLGDRTYRFYGRLKLHQWQKYWVYSFFGLIILFSIWILINL